MALCAKDIPKTIVFCRTKDVACKVYKFLLHASPKRKYVSMYHASLTQRTKKYIWDNFKNGQIRCISATIAFGMVCFFILINDHPYYTSLKGMDIPDVELVIVNGVPDSMLQFYQVELPIPKG